MAGDIFLVNVAANRSKSGLSPIVTIDGPALVIHLSAVIVFFNINSMTCLISFKLHC